MILVDFQWFSGQPCNFSCFKENLYFNWKHFTAKIQMFNWYRKSNKIGIGKKEPCKFSDCIMDKKKNFLWTWYLKNKKYPTNLFSKCHISIKKAVMISLISWCVVSQFIHSLCTTVTRLCPSLAVWSLGSDILRLFRPYMQF